MAQDAQVVSHEFSEDAPRSENPYVFVEFKGMTEDGQYDLNMEIYGWKTDDDLLTLADILKGLANNF